MSKQPKQQGGHPAEVIMYPALPIQRPAGEAGAASGPWGRDLGGAGEPGIPGSCITWYDVLGVLPGAEACKIKREYDAKAALLRPDLISGAPPERGHGGHAGTGTPGHGAGGARRPGQP